MVAKKTNESAMVCQYANKNYQESFCSKSLHSLGILNRPQVHFALMLRPILIFRVASLMVALRKFPLFPSDGHPQHCLFRIFDIITHGDIHGLSS